MAIRFNDTYGTEIIQTLDGSMAKVRAIQEMRRHPQSLGLGSRGIRGVVRGMSTASARRLRRLLSFIEYTPKSSFVTLTYRDAVDVVKLKRDIDVFGKLLRRKFPNAWAIWKIEKQERGVWHIHLLIFNIEYWHWKDLVAHWSRIAGFDASRATDIQQIKSLSALRKYLSKYIAKTVDIDEHTGRIWGIINRKRAVFGLVRIYATARGLFVIRRVMRRLRYDPQYLTFWVYRAQFVQRLLDGLGLSFYREHERCLYGELRTILY